MKTNYINIKQFERFAEAAYQHYLTSSPPVSNYLDTVINEMADDWYYVTLFEAVRISNLYQDNEWMSPDLAQDHVLKTMDRAGRDTSHIMGA